LRGGDWFSPQSLKIHHWPHSFPSISVHDLKVRAFTDDDVAAIYSIQSQCPQAAQWRREEYLQFARNPTGTIFVAEIDALNRAEVVGFAAFHHLMGEAELRNLAIHPSRRRKGMARALLEAGIHQMQEAGVRRIFLEVRASNRPALAFYASAGFKLLQTRNDYYHDPIEDALVMTRDLHTS